MAFGSKKGRDEGAGGCGMAPYAETMARYNRWMNERLYEACTQLTDDQRKRNVGAFFQSVHGTLNHILLADRTWLARFAGEPVLYTSLNQELYSDFSDLQRERKQDDARIVAWAKTLTPDDLACPLRFTGIASPESRTYPLGLVVTHFFNHQTHHRGQVTTLLSQHGIDPGVTDLLRLPGAWGAQA